MAIFKAGDDEPLPWGTMGYHGVPWGTMGYHMFRRNPFGYDLRLKRNAFLGKTIPLGWKLDEILTRVQFLKDLT